LNPWLSRSRFSPDNVHEFVFGQLSSGRHMDQRDLSDFILKGDLVVIPKIEPGADNDHGAILITIAVLKLKSA
jgi:hypothetical protein